MLRTLVRFSGVFRDPSSLRLLPRGQSCNFLLEYSTATSGKTDWTGSIHLAYISELTKLFLSLPERKRFYQDVTISQGEGRCPASCKSSCSISVNLSKRAGKVCNAFQLLQFQMLSYECRWVIWDQPRQKEAENTWREVVHCTKRSTCHCCGNRMGCTKRHAQILHHASGMRVHLLHLVCSCLIDTQFLHFMWGKNVFWIVSTYFWQKLCPVLFYIVIKFSCVMSSTKNWLFYM